MGKTKSQRGDTQMNEKWPVKCCKCDKISVGKYRGKAYCTMHLLEAMMQSREEK